ncbi:MAG: N-acetylglucosamine-6-phosphate deacetylase [Lachnospiraceae bacterium]|nr:N-acetylglucosamine-6-phosphate deacetylase [Lachnospiraceae bacterium]
MGNRILLKNGYFFLQKSFHNGSVLIEDGIIRKIYTSEDADVKEEQIMDLQGAYVIPGLVDLHIHGAVGEDVSDGSAEGLCRMADYLAKQGVTSFLPTTMTLPREQLLKVCDAFLEADRVRSDVTARMIGLRLEGPFLSREKCGAQNKDYLQNPNPELWEELKRKSNGNIKILDLAPELPGALEFINSEKNSLISVAHTTADYETAGKAFEAGAKHVTHLFNAMPPMLHRAPGVIGAAAERKEVTAELISDGVHVHPSMVRVAFSLFPDRLCLVSDALRGLGMPEGEYDLSGQKVWVRDGRITLADGTLAGSACNLYVDLLKAVEFGIEKETAIYAATTLPANRINNSQIGAIEEGRYADLVICDKDLRLQKVLVGGVAVS